MSKYEWERGEFVLPSAEFASFRQAMQEVEQKRKEKAFAHTQDFWKSLTRKQQTDPGEYTKALNAWEQRTNARSLASTRSWNGWNAPAPDKHEAVQEAYLLLENVVREGWVRNPATGQTERSPGKVRRIQVKDMNYPTNRTTQFEAGVYGDGTVTFNKEKKAVTWSVGENNHAIDHARESVIGKAFFDRLDQVRWTHGTGGTIVGNDEYNRDSDYVGGGGNYCTGAYGYLGAEQEPTSAKPFTNARGQRVTPEIKYTGRGFNGYSVKLVTTETAESRAKAAAKAAKSGTTRAKTTAASTSGSFASRTRSAPQTSL